MKKLMRIYPQGIGAGNGVTECQNLVVCDAEGGEVLGVAPQVVSVAEGVCRPLATRCGTDGKTTTLWARTLPGGDEGLWSNCAENEEVFTLIQEAVSSHCAVATADGFIVMTDNGPMKLFEQEDDGTLAVADGIEGIPEGITLEGVDMGQLSASTAAMTMTGMDFSRTSPQLSISDKKRISESLTDAYSQLSATASDGGMWLQPVVARWHLISNKGERLYSSSPILVAPNGWQCMGGYSAECEKNDATLAVPQIDIRANAYRMKLTVSEEAANRIVAAGVASIEVECSPQQHIIDFSSIASIRIINHGTDTPKLTVFLPGAADYFSSRESVYAEQLGLIASKIEDLGHTLAALQYPISAGSTIISRPIAGSVKEEQKKIANIITKAVKRSMNFGDAALLSSVCAPHTFTAQTATVSGQTVVWGDVTPILSTRLSARQMCDGWAEGNSDGFIKVTRRDGGVYSSQFSFSQTPTRWAPAVMISDVEAVRLEIYFRKADGSVWQGKLDLHTMADGLHSGNLSKGLIGETFVLSGSDLPMIPRNSIGIDRKPGAILAANIGSAQKVIAAADCCNSQIINMLPAVKSQSSWDFSRCHIYAMTQMGVYAVNLNTLRRVISNSLIDSRGIETAESVTRTDDNVVMIYEDRVLKLSASHAEDVGLGCKHRQVAYDATTGRLWFLDQRGCLVVSDLAMKSMSRVTLPFDVENIYSANNRLWVSDSDGLYRMTTDEELAQKQIQVPIKWIRSVDLPIGKRLRFVEFRISASQFKGELIVRERSETTDGKGRELMNLSLDRAVKAPIKQRIAVANVPWIEIAINGETSPDFRLEEVIMHLV